MAWQNALDDYRGMSKHKRPESYSEIQAGIGARIEWARTLVEPNRSAYARQIGVDASTLKKIETGERAPSVFNIIELAARLRVSTDYLLRGLLTAQTDEEMAVTLAALHPELVLQPRNKGPGMGSDPDGGMPIRPTTPRPNA